MMPCLTTVLELKMVVDSVCWLDECYMGREEMESKAICWRGLIFEASCMYSKISPSPLWAISTAEILERLYSGGYGIYFNYISSSILLF